MTTEEFMKRYEALGHAIQSGVQMEQSRGSDAGSPKHLRTGLDLQRADLGSLGRLLIKKGVITEEEYFDAIIQGLEAEKESYERRLEADMGGKTKITLA